MIILSIAAPEGPDANEALARMAFISELRSIHPELALWAAQELAIGNSIDQVKETLARVCRAADLDRSSLYNRIKQAWHTHTMSLGDNIHPWTAPPHIQGQESKARALDKQFGELIREPVQMWQDGLISGVELLDKMLIAADTRE